MRAGSGLDGPQQGCAADGERGRVGAEHDFVEQLGVKDAVPALGAFGVAQRRKVLVLVLEVRAAEINPVLADHGLDYGPGGRDVGGVGGNGPIARALHDLLCDQGVQFGACRNLGWFDHRGASLSYRHTGMFVDDQASGVIESFPVS